MTAWKVVRSTIFNLAQSAFESHLGIGYKSANPSTWTAWLNVAMLDIRADFKRNLWILWMVPDLDGAGAVENETLNKKQS
jgi:hypothetical protein